MINLLELRHFKCFELLRLPLGRLTVLSGTNASGKSSVLQALVLLHQTMRDHEWADRLTLNGNVIQAGTVLDIVDQVSGGNRFEIGLGHDVARCRWAFVGDRKDMSAHLDEISIDDHIVSASETLRWLMPIGKAGAPLDIALALRDLIYITAERDGPREVYPVLDEFGFQSVGSRGEYAVSTLLHRSGDRVGSELIVRGTAPTLVRQVEARLDSFFPGCRLQLQQVQHVNAATLRIKISEETDFLRPVHCGFGITQILPIIVAILSARAHSRTYDVEPMRKGELISGGATENVAEAQLPYRHSDDGSSPIVLIENPEVHLHPAGQAKMGEFLAEAAHAGVQVIAETHSDHVLNGIRRAVKSGRVAAEDVAVHFFRDRFAYDSQVLTPTIDSTGGIDVWPEGFFDQFDKDLNYFAGWSE